jgi:hypothetical protein
MEFDGRRLTVVGFRGRGKRRHVERLGVIEWPEPPSADDLFTVLRTVVPRGRPTVRVAINTARGMVRRFIIPRVPAHKRYAAAMWEGKQLVPFPLDNKQAYFGMEFTSADERGWWVTLVALPRADAESLVSAVARLGWRLDSLVLAGTRHPATEKVQPNDLRTRKEAAVFFSPRRNSFAVFENKQLVFHYDLGPLPGVSADPAHWTPSDDGHSSASWITNISPAINDAIDFYLSAHQSSAPTHLALIGARETMAPVIHYVNDEWQERFPNGVIIQNPLDAYTGDLPAEISGWAEANSSSLTHAVLAATGIWSINLIPTDIRQRHHQQRLVKYTRTAFFISVAVTMVVTGLLAKHLQTVSHSIELARQKSHALQQSQPAIAATAGMGELARRRALLAEIRTPPTRWMPWIKTLLGTVPHNGQLAAATIQFDAARPADDSLLVHLEGTLSPDGPAHAISYRNWITQLELLSGAGRVKLIREHTTTWKGRQRSNFLIELRPPCAMVVR